MSLASAAAPERRWQRRQGAARRWAWWGAMLGLVLGGLSQAPASWLAAAVLDASGGRLLLAEARGTVWTGSAVAVLSGGAGSRDASALPGRLQWRLRPGWQGMAPSLGLALEHPGHSQGPLELALSPRWGGFELALLATPQAPAQWQWPAAWLAGLGTPWNTLQLGGQLQLRSPGLRLRSGQGRLQLDGALALELHGASSRLSPLPALGSYRLVLDSQGGTARLNLATLDGALRLSGEGQPASMPGRGPGWRFRGLAEAAPGHEAALANLLNIIGRRQGAQSVISIG